MNRKLKFDPQNTNKQLLSSNQEDKNQQNQHTFQQPIHNQHPSQQQTRQNLNRIEESQVSQELQEEEQNIKSQSKLQNSNRPRNFLMFMKVDFFRINTKTKPFNYSVNFELT